MCFKQSLHPIKFVCAALDASKKGSGLHSGFMATKAEEDIECPLTNGPLECSACPAGGCASCDGGVLRIKPGFATSTPYASKKVPIDEVVGVRPIYRCPKANGMLPTDICLGDDWLYPKYLGDDVVQGPIAAPTWENLIACASETGSPEDKCLKAGRCTYTKATKKCEVASLKVANWCGPGYEGPLCANCAEGFARTGTNRFSECNSCDDTPTATMYWIAIGIAAAAFVFLESKLFGKFESQVEEIETGKAPIGVALVIGNSKYENWPTNRPAKQDSISIEAELKKLGYITFLVNDATKKEMQTAIRRFRLTLEQVSNPKRYAHLKDPTTGEYTANPWPSLHAPGLREGEVAGLIFYAGHATQFTDSEETTENFLVPVDCDLNAERSACLPVLELMDRTSSAFRVDQRAGPFIVMIDAGHAIGFGPPAEGGRDTFMCPISKRLMVDPVKLVQDGDDSWSYERAALERILLSTESGPVGSAIGDLDRLGSATCESPMTGEPIIDPTIIADDELKEDIREFKKRSTLCSVTPADDNSMIIFACEPQQFSVFSEDGEKGGIFSQQFVKVASLRVNIIEQMQKLRPLIIEASGGNQAPWFATNLSEDAQNFSISGKFAIEGGTKENDNPDFRADLGEGLTVDAMLAVLEAKEKDGGTLLPPQKVQLEKLQKQVAAGDSNPIRVFYKTHKATFFTWVALGQVLNGVGFAFNIQYPARFVTIIKPFKTICIDIFGQITFGCIWPTWNYENGMFCQLVSIPVVVGTLYLIVNIRENRLIAMGQPAPGTPTSADRE